MPLEPQQARQSGRTSPSGGHHARPGHQLSRHPLQGLTSPQQIGFQAAGHLPTVLHRETPLRPLPRPAQRLSVTLRSRRHCLHRQLAAQLIDRHQRMRALVRVDPNHHHELRSLVRARGCAGTGTEDMPLSRRGQAPIKSQPDRTRARLAKQHIKDKPQQGWATTKRTNPTRHPGSSHKDNRIRARRCGRKSARPPILARFGTVAAQTVPMNGVQHLLRPIRWAWWSRRET
jgi:hypothetical protein